MERTNSPLRTPCVSSVGRKSLSGDRLLTSYFHKENDYIALVSRRRRDIAIPLSRCRGFAEHIVPLFGRNRLWRLHAHRREIGEDAIEHCAQAGGYSARGQRGAHVRSLFVNERYALPVVRPWHAWAIAAPRVGNCALLPGQHRGKRPSWSFPRLSSRRVHGRIRNCPDRTANNLTADVTEIAGTPSY
jgi:hypothetical protein